MKDNKLGDIKMFIYDFDSGAIGNKILPDGTIKQVLAILSEEQVWMSVHSFFSPKGRYVNHWYSSAHPFGNFFV